MKGENSEKGGKGEKGQGQATARHRVEGPVAVVHLDESCLGNGREGTTPGGAGGLIEVRTARSLERRDFYIHAPDTTNNRMALCGAIAVLQILSGRGRRLSVLLISDSEYLVRGMRDWVPGWAARGWKRKGGEVENLQLWQALVASADRHVTQFTWVRGHAGHPKNEYANHLAMSAARDQVTSPGAVASGFEAWLESRWAAGQYPHYDPNAAFDELARRILGGERLPLDAGA
jgi:ribonuclease HI